jgi:hypothetical protein
MSPTAGFTHASSRLGGGATLITDRTDLDLGA